IRQQRGRVAVLQVQGGALDDLVAAHRERHAGRALDAAQGDLVVDAQLAQGGAALAQVLPHRQQGRRVAGHRRGHGRGRVLRMGEADGESKGEGGRGSQAHAGTGWVEKGTDAGAHALSPARGRRKPSRLLLAICRPSATKPRTLARMTPPSEPRKVSRSWWPHCDIHRSARAKVEATSQRSCSRFSSANSMLRPWSSRSWRTTAGRRWLRPRWPSSMCTSVPGATGYAPSGRRAMPPVEKSTVWQGTAVPSGRCSTAGMRSGTR